MKRNLNPATHKKHPANRALRTVLVLLAMALSGLVTAATKTAITTGNWSTAAIWSPSGVPAAGDDVVITSGVTVTVDGVDTCRNLNIGTNSNGGGSVKIITNGNSLRCTGDLQINPNSKTGTYLLDAGPGAINVAGTFSTWGTTGTNKLQVGSGSMTLAPAVAITDASQQIAFTGGGTITFSSSFADGFNKMTFYTGCTVNFYGSYTITGSNVDWGGAGTANFYGTGTITDTKNILLHHVNIMASASTTMAAGAGTLEITGNLTLGSAATLTMNEDLQLDGNLTNNGGSISAGAVTLTMNGTSSTIGGTTSFTLSTLQIGKTTGSADCFVTANRSFTCSYLNISKAAKSRSLSLSSGVTLTVNNDLTLVQPTKDSRYTMLDVNAGTCTVGGNLLFTGNNNGTTRVCKVNVTTGTFTLGGTITWLSNTAILTEVITVSSGTINFTSSITQDTKSGTIAVTSTGNLNFNGTSAPSLNFGGATAPALNTSYGSTIKFAKGLTATTTPITFASGSTQIFSGTGTITPSAAITFGTIQINASCTVTLAGNISVKGDWTDNGTFTPSTYTVSFNGTSLQYITRTGGETFYGVVGTPYVTTIQLNNNVTITNSLTMNGATFNANGYTLQLGNGSGAALVYSAGQVYGGTFKRYWPASAITSTSGNYYGLFPVGTATDYRPVTINSTVSPTGAGYVSVSHTTSINATNLTYTDNEGSSIQQIADKHSDISYSSITGGTYNLDVKMTDMGSAGNISNLKMIWYDSGTPGSAGTHSTTTGSISNPIGHRTGLSLANLAHNWVIGTNDRNATPMYVYVYSRKSGNWNDNSATGTWSYTAGGSGAACSCLPTTSGYAVIETGHTVTVTATDTCKFLDIKTGAGLTINSSKVFNVNGSLYMYGTATFTNNGSLVVANELLLSSATTPTVNGNVTAVYFTMPSGTAYTQTSGSLTVTGELALSGAMTMGASGSLVFTTSSGHLSGTGGTYQTASGGSFPMTNNKVVEPGTSITIGTAGTNTTLAVSANTTVNNIGSIIVNGNVTGANASTSIWINNATALLSSTGTIFSTGILDATTAPNTIEYSGSGAQTVLVPYGSYNILKMANSGTKTLAGDMYVDSSLVIGGSVILDESTNVIYGDGGITMTGTSELKLSRATDNSVYPELNGVYNLTGGTVTLYQTGDSCQIHPATYYNLKCNGSTPYDLGAVVGVTNNLDFQGSAYFSDNSILNVGGTFTYASSASSMMGDSIAANGIVLSTGTVNTNGESINVYGSTGWSKATAATFTPSTGTVYFTGTSNQTLGGTSASQTFNNLVINKSSNTLTVGGSTTTLNISNDLTLSAGVFDKGTATAINMTGGNWNNNGGSFTCGTGTVTFNSTSVDQAIQGTGGSETFYNLIVNKTGYSLAVGQAITTLSIGGTTTLTAGDFTAGTAADINMTAGNWTNNGGTFTPGTGTITFNGSGAQAINGTTASQTFNKLTVNKSANTLSVGGSTTSLTANSNVTLTAGTFDKGTATTINAGGNWTNNGGTFTYGTGTVNFNGTAAQAINGTASAQTFYNLTVNKSADTLSISGSTGTVTVNNTLTFTSGMIKTGSNKISIPTTGSVSGAAAGKYIYGNEEMFIPNSAAPSKTFDIGDYSTYAPVTLAFSGTVSGSGSITASTTAGDDADISNSGINSSNSVNRTWTLSNSSVGGFTSYAPVFNFVAGDIDGGANTANFEIRRLTAGTWYAATAGTRAGTSTQATGETTFGKVQIGEKNTLTVAAHPSNASACYGTGTSFSSSSSSTPTPTIQWQRDPNTGIFANINGSTDGGVYSGYTSGTLSVSNVSGLNNYKYRAVFTNVNGSANSNQATLTATAIPTITGTTPNSRCDAGTVALGATASAGTINWYAASSGGSSLGTGTSFTTPSISSNTTYYVDATTSGCTTASRTSVLATVNTTPTITGTTPAARCDNGTVGLGATSSAGTINWYAASSGGASLGSGTSFTTPSISSNTTYYVDATANGCTTGSRTSVLATVNATPTITSTTPGAHCGPGKVNLAATASAGTINWYDASSGGSLVNTGTSWTTPTLFATTTYYVDATDNSCTTATRTAVVATIGTFPTVTGSTPAVRCDAGTVDLGATPSAGTINWFAASSGGVSLGSGTTWTTPSIPSTTTYYAEAASGGCNSIARTAVTATVSITPTATIAYQSCAGVDGNTTIRVSQTNGSSPFTYKLNSGSFSSADTFHLGNGSTNDFYVKDTYGCTSSANHYTATSVVPTQIATGSTSVTCNCPSVAEGREVYLTDATGNLVAIINDHGHDLQTITATVYIHPAPVLIANNQGGNSAAMGRNYVLNFTGTGLSPAVEVKFPYTTAELTALTSAAALTPDMSDDINSATDLGSTQYEGPNEDSIYDASSSTMLVYHRQLTNGTILGGKYVKIGLSANGEHWLHGNGNGTALPVKLISFTATANDALNRVETKWTTSLEINNDYFAVERSENGINFNEVGRITGAGNHTGMLDYRFDDPKPFNGISYYRLRQTDFDGQFVYSDVKSVMFGPYGFVQVYPNPTTEQANIEVSHPGKDIKLEVFDMNGRQIYGRTFETEYAGKTQVLTFHAKEILPVGMYMISITTNGTEYKKKLVIN
jgi:hypothetical protein